MTVCPYTMRRSISIRRREFACQTSDLDRNRIVRKFVCAPGHVVGIESSSSSSSDRGDGGSGGSSSSAPWRVVGTGIQYLEPLHAIWRRFICIGQDARSEAPGVITRVKSSFGPVTNAWPRAALGDKTCSHID